MHTPPDQLNDETRSALAELADRGDRASPMVFAGRDDEFDLLRRAAVGTRSGQPGRTVVLQGVAGVGKTALAAEYAKRTADEFDPGASSPLLAVPLTPGHLALPPGVLVAEIDRIVRDGIAGEGALAKLRNMVNVAADMTTAAATKRRMREFSEHGGHPPTLAAALKRHHPFDAAGAKATLVLLVDEAQTLADTPTVRTNLQELHMGVGGPGAMLACFGLGRTVDWLTHLGISRLSRGHARTMAALSAGEAEHTVGETLDRAFTHHVFGRGADDDHARRRWLGQARTAVLTGSSCFPHHLANGCSAVAEAVLNEGIGTDAPVHEIERLCQGHRREYYDARLKPWANHTVAMALAFAAAGGRLPAPALVQALQAADNDGLPVEGDLAASVCKGMCDDGFLNSRNGFVSVAVPSLLSHFRVVAAQQPRRSAVRSLVESTLNAERAQGR